MSISVHSRGDVSIVELKGEFTHAAGVLTLDPRGERLSDLGRTLHGLIEAGRSKIVIDLGGATFLDSSRIGDMIACRKRLILQGGGDIRLLRPVGKVRE